MPTDDTVSLHTTVDRSIVLHSSFRETENDGELMYSCYTKIVFSASKTTTKNAADVTRTDFTLDVLQETGTGNKVRKKEINTVTLSPEEAKDLAMFILHTLAPNNG